MTNTFTYSTTVSKPKLKIQYETYCISPREDSNAGYFLTSQNSRYNSPDNHEGYAYLMGEAADISSNTLEHIKNIKKLLKEEGNTDIIEVLPITKYEHSGVSYSIGTDSGFDSCVNGFYFVSMKMISQLIPKVTKAKILTIVANELEVYNSYVNGEVYNFILFDDEGEVEDSCCGFYAIEDIKEYLPTQWHTQDLNQYLV